MTLDGQAKTTLSVLGGAVMLTAAIVGAYYGVKGEMSAVKEWQVGFQSAVADQITRVEQNTGLRFENMAERIDTTNKLLQHLSTNVVEQYRAEVADLRDRLTAVREEQARRTTMVEGSARDMAAVLRDVADVEKRVRALEAKAGGPQ